MVDQASGGADDDVRIARQGLDLIVHANPAVDEGGAGSAGAGHAVDFVVNLTRQFTGRAEHQGDGASPSMVYRRLSTGSEKAAVLPVPVMAWPMRSLPVVTTGMAAAWMGDGFS